MPLPASGTITMLQILAEFGAPAGTGLTSMYRGGAYVPNTGPNAGVPTSGAISLQSFYGASGSSPLNASLSPSPADASGVRGNTLVVNVTASPSGGAGGYTYAWSWQSGGTGITISSATSATCALTSTTASGTITVTRSGTLQCIITDSASASVTRTVSSTFTFEGTA